MYFSITLPPSPTTISHFPGDPCNQLQRFFVRRCIIILVTTPENFREIWCTIWEKSQNSFHFTIPLHLTPLSFHFTSHIPLSLHYISHPYSIAILHFFLQIACCIHILFNSSNTIVQPTKRWWLQEIEGFCFEDQHAQRGPKEQHQAQQLTRSKF